MNVGKIKMAKGGERLEDVIGRTEDEEMPVFEGGAFEVEEGNGRKVGERLVDKEFVDNYIGRNKMGELIGSARIVEKGQLQCDEVGLRAILVVIRHCRLRSRWKKMSGQLKFQPGMSSGTLGLYHALRELAMIDAFLN